MDQYTNQKIKTVSELIELEGKNDKLVQNY